MEREGQRLYFECSHFRPEVGRMIFAQLDLLPPYQAPFGYYLTQDTINQSLSQILNDRKHWLASEPPVIVELDAIIPLSEDANV
jgi:hypothetical protein